MSQQRKNNPNYTQGVDSLGRTAWKRVSLKAKDSTPPSSSTPMNDVTSSHGSIHDVYADDIKDYLSSLTKEERDTEDYDDDRTMLCHLSKNGESDYIDSSSVAHNLSEPDSGATVDLINNTSITSGFAYSPYPERSHAVSAQNITADDISHYVNNNKDILSKEGHYLGVWHDPSDGTVYLDISVVSDDASHARQECHDKDQIAFYDMQMNESVTVNSEATSGGASQSL